MTKKIEPEFTPEGELIIKPTIVQVQAEVIASEHTFIRFRKRAMVQIEEPYPHFEPLSMERFKELFYPRIQGQTRSRVSDVYEQLTFAAVDLTDNDHLILFGQRNPADFAGERLEEGEPTRSIVWDSRTLTATAYEPAKTVWRSPYPQLKPGDDHVRIPFIMSLAGNDPGLYDDIMQSMAPIIMDKKPDGVVWWIGDGANGKSTLMDALYKIFPGQLSSITVKRLVDGRDTPNLNGTLANVVKESSEGRVDDTEIYKSIGTHEDFGAHKFHSQEGITIRGNLHHIFSGNQVPVFNDKGFSARRRTFIIPFNRRFTSDPTFEERTFTPEFFSQLIAELCRYAKQLEKQGYRYKFSAKTLAAKVEYDMEANNAEEFAEWLVDQGVVAFESFHPLRAEYENWCADMGYVPLGVGYMRRAIQAKGYQRVSFSTGMDKISKRYKLPAVFDKDLVTMGMGHPGMYTVEGFEPDEKIDPVVPEFKEQPKPPAETDPW